jgi:hypothetical protein
MVPIMHGPNAAARFFLDENEDDCSSMFDNDGVVDRAVAPASSSPLPTM